jgi:hypothetical protein
VRCLALLVPVALLIPAAAVPASAEPEAAAPAFAIGDWWKYRFIANSVYGTVRYTVKGFETVSVGGADREVVSFSYGGTGSYFDGSFSGALKVAGTFYLERGTFATVMDSATFEVEAKSETGDERHVISIYAYVSYDPPLKDTAFPLVAGKSWSQEVTEHSRAQATLDGKKVDGSDIDTKTPQSHTFKVSGPQKLKVDAGEFDAWVVDGNRVDGWFANDVGLSIWSSGPGGTLTLLEYSYSNGGILGLAPSYFGAAVAAIAVPSIVVGLLVRRHRRRKAERAAAGLADKKKASKPEKGVCPTCGGPLAYSDLMKCDWCERCKTLS